MTKPTADVYTKAQLSRDLNVSAPRISQYIRSGLPVRSDGKLNRTEVLKWLETYRVSGSNRLKGPALASGLLNDRESPAEAPAAAAPAGDNIRLLDALACVVHRCSELATRAVLMSGGSMELAYATDRFVALHIAETASRVARKARCRPPIDWPPLADLDWTALAGRPVGQAELDALEGTLCELPWHYTLGQEGA